MNKYWIITLAVIIAGIIASVAILHSIRMTKSMRPYHEAEPLVQQVWPLAADMQAYYSEHGSNACALADLTSDPATLSLEKYQPEFNPEGTNIFSMMVNESFGFTITDDFKPQWIFPEK